LYGFRGISGAQRKKAFAILSARKIYSGLVTRTPLRALTGRRTRRGCELVFHRVPDPVVLERQFAFICERYRPICLDEYLQRVNDRTLGERDVLVTFDDGTEDFYLHAVPAIRKHRCPVTVFVCGCILEGERSLWFMDYARLVRADRGVFHHVAERFGREKIPGPRQMAFLKSLPHDERKRWIQEGKAVVGGMEPDDDPSMRLMTVRQWEEILGFPEITLGAHTWDHVILANEPDGELEHQVLDTVEGLRSRLSAPVKAMAYPNGCRDLDFDERAMGAAEKAGLAAAFSLEDHDPFSASRWAFPRRAPINHDYSEREILARVEHRWPKIFTGNHRENRIRKQYDRPEASSGK